VQPNAAAWDQHPPGNIFGAIGKNRIPAATAAPAMTSTPAAGKLAANAPIVINSSAEAGSAPLG
jgi:hypothetical protein